MNRKIPTAELRSRAQTRLSRERGCGFADLRFALQLQLTVLAPQPKEFIALARRQGSISGKRLHLPAAFQLVGLGHPVADGLGRRLELTGEIGRIASGADQLDHLAAELHRVRGTGSRHGKHTSRESVLGVHQSGAVPIPVIHRRGPWCSFETAEYATLERVDWYNHRRLLAPIRNVPPAEAEGAIMLTSATKPWPPDPRQTASEKPGAVH